MQVRDLPLMQPSQTRLALAGRLNLGGRIGTLTRMDSHSFTIWHEMMLVTGTTVRTEEGCIPCALVPQVSAWRRTCAHSLHPLAEDLDRSFPDQSKNGH
jgi:hypothetical protein